MNAENSSSIFTKLADSLLDFEFYVSFNASVDCLDVTQVLNESIVKCVVLMTFLNHDGFLAAGVSLLQLPGALVDLAIHRSRPTSRRIERNPC